MTTNLFARANGFERFFFFPTRWAADRCHFLQRFLWPCAILATPHNQLYTLSIYFYIKSKITLKTAAQRAEITLLSNDFKHLVYDITWFLIQSAG